MTATEIPDLITAFRQGTEHLAQIGKSLEWPFDPAVEEPRRLHNMYVRNLVTCYVSKFVELSQGILEATDRDNYLVYVLCGRALIETTATLRYYIHQEYRPLMDQSQQAGAVDLPNLIAVDDRLWSTSKASVRKRRPQLITHQRSRSTSPLAWTSGQRSSQARS